MVKKGWKKVKLKEIGKIVTGKTPPTKNKEYYGNKYPFITPKDIIKDVPHTKTERFLSEKGKNYQANLMLPKNVVCYTCIASLGKMCITSEVSFTNQQINSIIVDEQHYDYRFVYYYLKNNKEKINIIASGVASPIINKSIFSEIEIEIPEDLNEQQKIASILSNYDDLIENNTKRIELLEKIAKLIYDEWFVRFKFPGHEKVKFVDSELGKIPEGWEVKKLKESVNNIILGGTPARKNPNYWGGDLPWIKSGKLNDLRIIEGTETITQEGLNKSATKMMPERTVLIAITGAILISLSEIKLCANQSVVGLYGSKDFSQEYLYLYQKKNIDQFISKMSGSAQQHVNKEIIQNSKILVPDIETMGSFNQIIKPIFNEISSLLFKNQNLKKTRDLLIPKLVSGEVDVSDLDIKVLKLQEEEND